MKLLIPALLGATLLITGCSTTTVSNVDTKADALNVNKFAGHNTEAHIKVDGKKATVVFPQLDNNMGENFAKTSCESDFDYIDSFKNLESGNSVAVYGGMWKLSNNNCAHFIEVQSAQFTDQMQMRYLLIDGENFAIAYDKMGLKPIISGNFIH